MHSDNTATTAGRQWTKAEYQHWNATGEFPEWHQKHHKLTFNIVEAEAKKTEGQSIALDNAGFLRKQRFQACKRELVRVAMGRTDGCVTADDSAAYCERMGWGAAALGNAAGSLFKDKCWEFTGELENSRRVTNHAHSNKVWCLVTIPDWYSESL